MRRALVLVCFFGCATPPRPPPESRPLVVSGTMEMPTVTYGPPMVCSLVYVSGPHKEDCHPDPNVIPLGTAVAK